MTTLQQTFEEAAASIADFARRWREGKASQSELENADILLLGLRRLLADYKAGQSPCPY
jgi:hypothetical protein